MGVGLGRLQFDPRHVMITRPKDVGFNLTAERWEVTIGVRLRRCLFGSSSIMITSPNAVGLNQTADSAGEMCVRLESSFFGAYPV